jgi:hypothetical protein
MKDFLKEINKTYFLRFGEYELSPLMQISAGLELEYIKKMRSQKIPLAPLVLTFLDKRSASVWSSLILLSNFFFEEYIENEVNGPQFKSGDKVSVYGCICKIDSISVDRITLEFKDQHMTLLSNETFRVSQLVRKMSKVPRERSLNKKSKYDAGKIAAKNKRNAISRILIPNDADTINRKNLQSKVLLISGRGNVGTISDFLNEESVYNESLSRIYGLDENLIVRKDLKPYIDLYSSDWKEKKNVFRTALEKLASMDNGEDITGRIRHFIEMIDSQDQITKEFDEEFQAFADNYKTEIPGVDFVFRKYPGVQDSLPENIKAVILNDIHQLDEYPSTINGFLNSGIPVIVISDRYVYDTTGLDFYRNLFTNNPGYYRLNWNRNKIKELMSLSSHDQYLDSELWELSKRYALQEIKIQVSRDPGPDELMVKLQKAISELDEYELLQKAYYQCLYPALYCLKNSNHKTPAVNAVIGEFEAVFNTCRGAGMPRETADLISAVIQTAYSAEYNTKNYNPEENIFTVPVRINGVYSFNIPCDTGHTCVPSYDKESLIYTGYPYREYSGNYLSEGVFKYYIPGIKVLCWPREGTLTYNYLRKRILGGYFEDNINPLVDFPERFILKQSAQFGEEVDEILNIESSLKAGDDQESDLENVHKMWYKAYSAGSPNNSFRVVCNVLNFRDGTFMFLPKNSKVLATLESKGGHARVSNFSFSELSAGSKVFKFKKDRSIYRELAQKSGSVYRSYIQLEIWRDCLSKISGECGGDLNKMLDQLSGCKTAYGITGASPSIPNLRNWLYDDDMIMPDIENVRLILTAAGKEADGTEGLLGKLYTSYSVVKGDRISMANKIRLAISEQIVASDQAEAEEIEIRISGIPVAIDVKTVESLDNAEIEVDYQLTRKIIC